MEIIEAMERTILHCLSWRVCASTVIQVGHAILKLMMYQVHKDSFTVVKSSRWGTHCQAWPYIKGMP